MLSEYQTRPVEFVQEILGAHPRSYQEEALNALVERDRVCVRSPHGAGKSTIAAWATLWGLCSFPYIIVATTALAWRQLKDMLWPEIHYWIQKSKLASYGFVFKDGEDTLATEIRMGPKRGAIALVAKDEARMEGIHAPMVLYIFDEAREIPVPIWDAAEGASMGNRFMSLAISTPGAPAGRFYEIQAKKPGYEHWYAMHLTEATCLREVPKYRERRDRTEKQWGRTSSVFRRRILGEFAGDEEDSIFPIDLIERANRRWYELADLPMKDRALVRLGVDVGGTGSGQTVLARLYNDGYVRGTDNDPVHIERHAKPTKDQTAGYIKSALRENWHPDTGYSCTANIDAIGIGAFLVEDLISEKLPIVGVNTSNRTDEMDAANTTHFRNIRALQAWRLRERLEAGDIGLPPDDELTGDLVSMKYSNTQGGILVEDKDQIKRRIGRSPDCGDAVLLLMYDKPPLARIVVHEGYNPFFSG